MKSRLMFAALLPAIVSFAGAQASAQSDTGRTIIAASGQARQATVPDRATPFLMIPAVNVSSSIAGTAQPLSTNGWNRQFGIMSNTLLM